MQFCHFPSISIFTQNNYACRTNVSACVAVIAYKYYARELSGISESLNAPVEQSFDCCRHCKNMFFFSNLK